MPWTLERPFDSWFWDVPIIQTLAAQPRMAWAMTDFCIFGSPCWKRILVPIGNVDSRDLLRIARKCVGTGGRCSVTGQKHFHPDASARRSDFRSSRDHARPARLSFALAMFTMNARRFQRTRHLRGVGDYSLNASKDIDMRVIDLTPTCESETVVLEVRWLRSF